MKGGNSEPFMCRVTEHNHLFPEIGLLTTQNGDRTRPIDFLPGHQLANYQARRHCSASSGLLTPSTWVGIPGLTAVLLDLRAETASLTRRGPCFLIKQSPLMYERGCGGTLRLLWNHRPRKRTNPGGGEDAPALAFHCFCIF